jgi:HEAT repeat protein/beta-lactamase regulating signal transducer with metallopeptidase domain
MNATSALGWALLDFLWQGTLIALLAKLLLAALPERCGALRYALAVGALAAMLATVVFSTVRGMGAPAPIDAAPAVAEDPSVRAAESPVGSLEEPSSATAGELAAPAPAEARVDGMAAVAAQASLSWRRRVDGALPWIVGAWAVGALALSLRLLAGYSTTRRLVNAPRAPVPGRVSFLVERLKARLGVRRAVRVCCSGLTQVPAVVGWLQPVVLLPASAVSGLSHWQLEAILAHELAHVRRHDYLVNVLQALIETLLFYHPAVWWLGARIREEREHCCDDLAVAACGSAPRYAEALLSMEELRGAPALAPALTGGSLLRRVERLLAPRGRGFETFPRWMAGVSAAAVVLVFVATSELAGVDAQERVRVRTAELPTGVGDVLLHPDPSQPLTRRDEWAHAEASRRGYREYWVGHSIAPNPAFGEGVLMGRFDHNGGLVIGDGDGDGDGENSITISCGLMTTRSVHELKLPGVPLAPIVGAEPAEVGVLYLCTGRSGRTSVRRVHLATASLAVDFEGLPLLWLGRSDDQESVRDALARMDRAKSDEIRRDLVAVVGAHATSAVVVPELTRILASSRDEELRGQAADWLACHPTMEALTALDGAARRDRSGDVRREAAEAVSEMQFAPAFDVLVALTRELEDSDARGEAVEGLGERTEPAAIPTLEQIANNDRDSEIQCEAVETLGEIPSGAGLSSVSAIAHGHPDEEVRREAVETYGECAPVDQAISFLRHLMARDASSEVRCEAVETLGEIHDERVVGILTEIVDGRDDPDVQREAVETLGETIAGAAVMPVLERIAIHHASVDVRREACETLGELHDERVVDVLSRIVDGADDPEVQREAVESLGETILGAATAPVLERIARRHPVLDVQREAVETLGDLHEEENRVVDVLASLAADHPSEEIRIEAVDTLADCMPESQAAALFKRLLGSERSPRVREELKDALDEL